jgi:hypothetical protein
MRALSNHFHGGYYPANKQYLRNLPILIPENNEQKKSADKIVESVGVIVKAKLKLRDRKLSDRERQDLEGEVESHEHRIDEAVFRLYAVKGLPGG